MVGEPSGRAQVREVLMASPNEEQLPGTLQPTSPLLKGGYHCQNFPVTIIIISLCWKEMLGQKSTGMELVCSKMTLEECGPHTGI